MTYPYYIVVKGEPTHPSPAFDERFPTRADAERRMNDLCEEFPIWQGKLEVKESDSD